MTKKRTDEMHRAIDLLARAMPDGQLMAAMGPLAFLGAAAEHITAVEAERDAAMALLAAYFDFDNTDNDKYQAWLTALRDLVATHRTSGGAGGD